VEFLAGTVRDVGETVRAELDAIVKRGVTARNFQELTSLRQLENYRARCPDDAGQAAIRHLVRVIEDALATMTDERARAALTELLNLNHTVGKRVLNGKDGARGRAGEKLDVGPSQFLAYEPSLLDDLADLLVAGARPRVNDDAWVSFDWAHVISVAELVHRDLEVKVRPDLVITMSGPGSFAAFYMMKLNARDVPVVAAVTFPLRSREQDALRTFAAAARSAGWHRIETSKWVIFIPDVVEHYPPGSAVTILDDRVVSGEAQNALREYLTGKGYKTSCAALFFPPDVPIPDLVGGRPVKGRFELPWTTDRGRS
jgi:hypothetical protein